MKEYFIDVFDADTEQWVRIDKDPFYNKMTAVSVALAASSRYAGRSGLRIAVIERCDEDPATDLMVVDIYVSQLFYSGR